MKKEKYIGFREDGRKESIDLVATGLIDIDHPKIEWEDFSFYSKPYKERAELKTGYCH